MQRYCEEAKLILLEHEFTFLVPFMRSVSEIIFDEMNGPKREDRKSGDSSLGYIPNIDTFSPT